MAEKEYIEREAIIRKLNEIGGCDASDEWDKVWDMAIDTAVKAVERLPVADVSPVKHGHWIYENFYTHCSVCGKMAIYDKYGQEVESDYCPRCGAKMGGEVE